MALSASDLQSVYSLLSRSLSPDQSLRQSSESILAQCESRPGFCSCLLEIITAADLVSQVDVRLLASVYLKNSISRYWRQRARESSSCSISSEEKLHLRTKLLAYVREENPQIALQLAVIISKIARMDYPRDWQDFFSVLANQLQTADTLVSHRIFMILYRTLKELSTKRLSADQKFFAEIATGFYDYFWKFWQNDTTIILQSVNVISQYISGNTLFGSLNDLFTKWERWLLCSKIIRLLLVFGYSNDALLDEELQPVKETCPIILNAVQSFLSYISLDGDHKLCNFAKEACRKLMKVLIATQTRHPLTFGDSCILLPVTEFCLNKIINPEPPIWTFEPFLIQCMVLLKSILECKDYKLCLTGRVVSDDMMTLEQRKKNTSASVCSMLRTIFARERVILLCNVLIRRYFILTKDDADEWEKNPEGFYHEQDMIQWNEKLRSCAEALFIVLFENNRQLLGPVVISILNEAMNGSPPQDTDISSQMLLKDATYTAVGHVYYELSNQLDFDKWFKSTLSQELANCHSNMRLIHRKIALILGQWVSEIKGETRKMVYCALVGLLQHQDIAVKLASCRSLCFHIQDCNFSGEDFIGLLPTCWNCCFKIIDDIQEFDSKVQVLHLISVLIEHSAEKVVPFSSQLIEFFQKIWEESHGESLLQIYILGALKNFVCSLGFQSPICYGMLLPILRSGVDITNPDELNLLEDSVLLWEATLSHAPSMVTQLLDLFSYLPAIMERGFEHLQPAVSIMEEYIILGGNEFLNRHSSDVTKLLDSIVGSVNEKGLLSTIPVIDILIQLYPREAPPLLHGVLQKLVVICLSGDDNNLSKTTVRAASGAVLARVLVLNREYLVQLASEQPLGVILQQSGLSFNQNLLLCLVDLWLDKVDNITSLQRKMYALALSVILALRVNEVIDKLDEILSVCTSVILGGTDDSESSGDVTSCADGVEYGAVSCRELRKRQVRASDPIKQISLENSLRQNIQVCAAIHGEASFNAAINSIHPTALAQIKQALKMS